MLMPFDGRGELETGGMAPILPPVYGPANLIFTYGYQIYLIYVCMLHSIKTVFFSKSAVTPGHIISIRLLHNWIL